MEEQKKIITCVDEATFEHALTRGRKYQVLVHDVANRKVRIKGDNGRLRFCPEYCFDMEGADVPEIVKIDFLDDPDTLRHVEVDVYFSDGTQRWSFFATPEHLVNIRESDPTSVPVLLTPTDSTIILPQMTRRAVEEAIHYMEKHNLLSDCMKSF